MRSKLLTTLVCTLLLPLVACERSEAPKTAAAPPITLLPQGNEFTWARAALERNPTLEVIAADAQAGIFTVKVKSTGATQTLRLSELAAAPVAELAAISAAPPAAPPAPEPPAAVPAAAPEVAATPEPAPAAVAKAPVTDKGYTIDRSGGQLKVSGPGISIVSSGGVAAATQAEAGQRTVEPFICEGRRVMHFDNRSIYVDGNAIVARGGCEIYITNSRIVASGTALVVEDSLVHVANSTLEGVAAFDAGAGAKMYLRGSTFQGLPRRAERAVVQDQGGNVWR